MKHLFSLLLLLCVTLGAQAQDWHYSADVPYSGNSNTYRVSMWLPPSAHTRVRGLIMSSFTVAEWSFVRDSSLRVAADSQQLAIIFFYPTPVTFLGGGNNPPLAADTTFILAALDSMARQSGFEEINHAPWLTFGHSTGSYFAKNMMWWKPERTFGAIIYKGGAYTPPTWSSKSTDHVPVLGVSGEFEEYGPNGGCAGPRLGPYNAFAFRDSILVRRGASMRALASHIILPGEGHFAYTKQGADYIAEFVREAAKARIPRDTVARNMPVTLVDPVYHTGWYTDTTMFSPSRIDSVATYTGADSAERFYHLTQSLAQKRLDFNAMMLNKTRQSITTTHGSIQDCSGSSYRATANANSTFTVNATNTGSEAVMSNLVAGSAIHQGNNEYTFDGGWFPEDRSSTINLYTTANATEQKAERMLRLTANLVSGNPQTISLTPPAWVQVGDIINLSGTASSGLPVNYTVIAGPGTVTGTQLKVDSFNTASGRTYILLRSWQLGGSGFATATPLTHRIPVVGPITVDARPNVSAANVRLAPNPGSEYVDVLLPAANATITVMDVQGRLLHQQVAATTEARLQLGHLAPGAYVVRVQTGNSTQVLRWMKQ